MFTLRMLKKVFRVLVIGKFSKTGFRIANEMLWEYRMSYVLCLPYETILNVIAGLRLRALELEEEMEHNSGEEDPAGLQEFPVEFYKAVKGIGQLREVIDLLVNHCAKMRETKYYKERYKGGEILK